MPVRITHFTLHHFKFRPPIACNPILMPAIKINTPLSRIHGRLIYSTHFYFFHPHLLVILRLTGSVAGIDTIAPTYGHLSQGYNPLFNHCPRIVVPTKVKHVMSTPHASRLGFLIYEISDIYLLPL